MASPFVAGEGDLGNDRPEVPQQNEAQQAAPDPTKEEMIAAILMLQQQVAGLQTKAAEAMQGLGAGVNQAQQTANLAGAAATGIGQGIGIGQQSILSANVRIPQPARFKGTTSGPRVLEWAHQASTYLRAAELEDSERGVWHISNFFEEDAAVWWRLQCDKFKRGLATVPTKWTELEGQLIAQFQIFNHVTDVRDKFHALRQTTSVSNYINRFRALVVELPDETEGNQIYQFLKGLKPEIQARTRTHKPRSLTEAMDIADEADRAHYHAYKSAGFTDREGSYLDVTPRMPSGPTPMEVNSVSINSVSVVVRTPAEMKRLREEKRCFNCRETGHALQDCPNGPIRSVQTS